MKHKCVVRDCKQEGSLIWDKGLAYFCDKHFKEQLDKVKKECGLK